MKITKSVCGLISFSSLIQVVSMTVMIAHSTDVTSIVFKHIVLILLLER
jgi:hypothetical protein